MLRTLLILSFVSYATADCGGTPVADCASGCVTTYGDIDADGILTITAGTTELPDGAYNNKPYEDCNVIKGIVFPDTLTYIGDYFFAEMDDSGSSNKGRGLQTDLVIPDSVTYIGNYAFSYSFYRYQVTALSLTLGSSVTTIGSYAFRNNRFSSFTIPESVTYIGSKAFYYRYCSLTNCDDPVWDISIPHSVSYIGNSAFEKSSKVGALHTLRVCNRLTVGWSATWFDGAYNGYPTYQNLQNTVEEKASCGCDGGIGTIADGTLTITSDAITPHQLSLLGDTCNHVTTISLPNTLTSIGTEAFKGTSWAADINIPVGVTSIEASTFQDSGITSVTGAAGVTSIGASAFQGSGLTSITLGAVSSIGASAFQDSGLTSFTIPDGVTSIEASTFKGTTSLTSLTIPDGVTSIGASAFQDSGLTSITIPNGVTSIGASAFQDTGLTSITIPDGVTSIGASTFEGTTSLTSLTIPDHVTSIEANAFKNSGLTSITLGTGITSIPNAFQDTTSLTSLSIPDHVISIEANAFQGSGLTSISFPDQVTSIGENAFEGSGLTSITFGAGITAIPNAFQNCQLDSFTLPDHIVSIAADAFKGNTLSQGFTLSTSGEGLFIQYANLAGVSFVDDAVVVKGCKKYSPNLIDEDVCIEGCTYDAYVEHNPSALIDDGSCETLNNAGGVDATDCGALKSAYQAQSCCGN